MIKIFSLILAYFLFVSFSQADHGPKKMWEKQIQPYFNLHETKQFGSFKINVHSYGKKQNLDLLNIKKENHDKIFNDKNNLAALVRKNNEFVYTKFNKKRNINNNTFLHGMSMSKTALATVVGTLLCNGKISSLDDELGKYSPSLSKTPFSNA